MARGLSDGRYLRGVTALLGPERAFWLRVSGSGAIDSCWVWTGAIDKVTGYGRVSFRGSEKYAHRESWRQMVGVIPDGLQLDHLCRVRSCINPWHLDAVSPRVNVRRGSSPGALSLARDRCARGHDFAQWGAVYTGRRVCRLCKAAYHRTYKRQGGGPVDMAAALADYTLEDRASLAAKPSHRTGRPVDMRVLAEEVARDRRAAVEYGSIDRQAVA